jgi:hypothetical protein
MTRPPSPPTPSPVGGGATAQIATGAVGNCSSLPIPAGSNSCRTGAWKTELQSQLCNRFGLTVTVAHYPTGASKWNPIEHRLFSEISKNWAAEPLDSYPKVLNFIRNTCTRTGLTVSAYLDRKHYPTGTSPDPEQIRRLSLKRHSTLPAWNYTIAPM